MDLIQEQVNTTRQVERAAMVRATISRRIEDLISDYPKIPTARLLVPLLRAKDEVQGQPFDWGDERTLKKIESFERELASSYNRETGEWNDEPADDEFILSILSGRHGNN